MKWRCDRCGGSPARPNRGWGAVEAVTGEVSGGDVVEFKVEVGGSGEVLVDSEIHRNI